jgi:hypothetical protein
MPHRKFKKEKTSRRDQGEGRKELPERPAIYLQASGPGIRRYSHLVMKSTRVSGRVRAQWEGSEKGL